MAQTAGLLTLADLDRLKQAVLFTEEDAEALRRAGAALAPRIEELLDVWYGFVGAHDFLLAYFSTPEGPSAEYLAGVRRRFGRWVLDLTSARFDEEWLAYQEEIGRRHAVVKGATDGVEGTPELVHYRYMVALVYPIFATVRPFLAEAEPDPEQVERMHQAWLKALLLSLALWSRPYVAEGAF